MLFRLRVATLIISYRTQISQYLLILLHEIRSIILDAALYTSHKVPELCETVTYIHQCTYFLDVTMMQDHLKLITWAWMWKKFLRLTERKIKEENIYKDHVVAAIIKIHAHMTYLSDDMSMLVARISWVPYSGFFSLINTICGL